MTTQRLIEGSKQLSRVVLNTVTQTTNIIPVPQRLPPLPTPKDLLRVYRIRAKKHLNQNFLLYRKYNEKIVHTSNIKNGDYVLELGANVGAISREILERGPIQFYVLERDRRFLPMLEMLSDAAIPGQMHVMLGNALSYNFDNIFPEEAVRDWNDEIPNIKVISNLPFNIGLPMIVRWMKNISNKEGIYRYGRVPLTMTFQKEIAHRVSADVLDLHRTRLSIMCQNYCDVKLKFDILGKYYVPKPEVDVGVVTFIPKKEPIIKDVPFEKLERFIRHFFHYRRKYIRHCTGTLFPEHLNHLNVELYKKTGIDPELSCAWLSIEEIGQLLKVYLGFCEEYVGLEEYDYRAPKTDRDNQIVHQMINKQNA